MIRQVFFDTISSPVSIRGAVRRELVAGATVKESLTVQIKLRPLRTAEDSSAVQIDYHSTTAQGRLHFNPSGFHE